MSVLSYFSPIQSPWFTKFLNRPTAVRTNKHKATNGQVYLIGAGPGDPELITLKAHRLLQNADVVLYDWLVSDELINTLPANTHLVFVGKRAGKHSMPQSEICQLLVHYAQKGLNVVRLKGGDPSIFARINEEAEALEKQQINYAIIPGVTTACAASAYTGIPLTARGIARSVTFLTAQFANPNKQPNWTNYSYQTDNNNPTLVVYMGLSRLTQLTQGLASVGWPKSTPIALIENATTQQQKMICSNLAEINSLLKKNPLQGPTLIVVGEVINHKMAITSQLLHATQFAL